MGTTKPFSRYFLLTFLVVLLAGWVLCFPNILSPKLNITAPVGSNVNFSCIAKDDDGQWVKWEKVDTGYIIAIETHVLIIDPRISVSLEDNSTWTLHIQTVQKDDAGSYKCSFNTSPTLSQTVFLDVFEVPVPPTIVRSMVSTTMQEGFTLTLICHVEGYPKPTVLWTRDDHNPIYISTNDSSTMKRQQMTYKGEILQMTQVTRADAGRYRCIANNSIPPTATKSTDLVVTFKPEIQVPTPLIVGRVGNELKLNCTVESSPMAVSYWTRESDTGISEMIYVGKEYGVTENHTDYTANITLIIRQFKLHHVGVYYCTAVNMHGKTQGHLEVHGLVLPTEPQRIGETKTDNNSWKERETYFTADINPKRGYNNVTSVNSIKKKGYHQTNRSPSRTTFYKTLTFLRLFGLLMNFH